MEEAQEKGWQMLLLLLLLLLLQVSMALPDNRHQEMKDKCPKVPIVINKSDKVFSVIECLEGGEYLE